MFLIAGLGNPGKKYEKTRHNLGFMVIDELARRNSVSVDKSKFRALIGEFNLGGEKVILMKPQTYMNLSGDALREAVNFYKIDPKNVLVIYDDLDIPIGALRIRTSGSPGTHNGMKSVVAQLGSRDFPRVRIGIGSNKDDNLIDFVIGKPSKSEEGVLADTVSEAALAVECYIKDGIDKAMNRFNSGKVAKSNRSLC